MLRIPSGNVGTILYFDAVDVTDGVTRETGLTGFVVYRSGNGGAAAAMTTPTIAEISAANMPGVYGLLVDESTSLTGGYDNAELHFYITHASMRPVSIGVEIYRPDTVRHSVAQAGGSNTVTLDASASATTDFYKGMLIVLVSGTGEGQAAYCTAYNGTTKVATVNRTWTTNPASGTGVAVYPNRLFLQNDDVQCYVNSGTLEGIISTPVDANMVEIDSNADAANRLKRAANAIAIGTVGSGSTTTNVVTSSIVPSTVSTDQFKARVLIFDKDTTTTGLRGQAVEISGNTVGGQFTVSPPLTNSPVSGDTFSIT